MSRDPSIIHMSPSWIRGLYEVQAGLPDGRYVPARTLTSDKVGLVRGGVLLAQRVVSPSILSDSREIRHVFHRKHAQVRAIATRPSEK